MLAPWGMLLWLCAFAVASDWRGKGEITADDAGLTLRQRRRERFIPWGDIVVCVKAGSAQDRRISGMYWLRGREHGVHFTLSPVLNLADATNPAMAAPTFKALGLDPRTQHYAANARRLVATIVARGGVPVRCVTGGARGRGNDANVLRYLNADDMAQLPLAVAQPDRAGDAAGLLRQQVTLGYRLPWAPLLGFGLLFAPLPGGCMWGFFATGLFRAPDVTLSSVTTIAADMTIAALALALGIGLAYVTRRASEPVVVARPEGLLINTNQSASTVTIPWEAIRAWVMQPPAAPGEPTRYAVATDTRTVVWLERPHAKLLGYGVQGDRRTAYQAAAARLHASIVAYTGLPLRDARAGA